MYVALNISNSNIKILSLKGRRVKKWASLDLASGLLRDGLIQQPEAVGNAINSLFKSTGMPRDRVITSIAGISFTYRFLNLPRVKPALLEEAILRAAKKEISLPLDELYLSWQPLPGKDDEQAFFVLGVPRNLVDAAVQTLKIAGVEPYLMDLRPLALARTANRRDAIVVNLEPDYFDIVFITGGIPTIIHTIHPRSDGATLEDNIRRLADELTKTAAFYQSNHPDIQLSPSTPLLLTGDLTVESPAGGLLQSEIEYPVEPLVPPVAFPEDLPIASYAVSIGLALKQTPLKTSARGEVSLFSDININVLAGKYRKPKAKPIRAGNLLLVILLAVAIALLYPLYHSRIQIKADNAELETDLNNVNRELNLANLVAAEVAATESSIQTILTTTKNFKTANSIILGTRGDFTADLQLVSSVLPSGAYFTNIEIGSNDITVQGETDSVFTAVDYATALESTGKFSGVRIASLDEANSTITGGEQTTTPSPEDSVIAFEIIIQKQAPAVSDNK